MKLNWLDILRNFRGTRFKKRWALFLAFLILAALSAGTFFLLNKSSSGNFQSIANKLKGVSLVVQTGHTADVSAVAFSPDGKLIASGSKDHTVKIWDLSTGLQLHTFMVSNDPDSINVLVFSPDSSKLACGDSHGQISIWELGQQYNLRAEVVHGAGKLQVMSLAFSPDGKKLASGGEDCKILIWNLADLPVPPAAAAALQAPSDTNKNNIAAGQMLFEHKRPVTAIAYSPDGNTIVSGSADRSIKIWDLGKGSSKSTIAVNGTVSSLSFTADGKQFASGSSDDFERIRIFDLAAGKESSALSGRGRVVAFDSSAKTLASIGMRHCIEVWNLAKGSASQTARNLVLPDAQALAFNAEGKMLAIANGININVYDVVAGKQIRNLSAHAVGLVSLSFSADGKTLACAGADHNIRVLDLTNGREMRSFHDDDEVISTALNPDATVLASGGFGLTIWDLMSGRRLRRITFTELGHVIALAFSPDGKIIASAGDSWGPGRKRSDPDFFSITLWDAKSGQKIRKIGAHGDYVYALAFSPDGKTLASGSTDRTARLWDLASGGLLKTFSGHPQGVKALAFSSDGKTLASGSETARIWNVSSGELLSTLGDAGRGPVKSLLFGPENETLICATNTVDVWTLNKAKGKDSGADKGEAGNLLATLSGDDAHLVKQLALTPDRKFLASCSLDGSMNLWQTGNWKELCHIIPLDKTDWAVLGAKGSFDASAQGSALLNLRVGNDIVALTQLKHRFYEPGLLAKLLGFNKEPMHDVVSLEKISPFPEISCEAPQPGSTIVRIKLKNRGGGYGKIDLKLNDKLLASDLLPRSLDANAAEQTIQVDLAKLPRKPGEENTISVRAFDKDNLLCSKNVLVSWTPPGKKEKGPIDLWVIIGGVSKYGASELNLKFSGKDARDIAKALSLGGKRLFGADRVHLTLLSNAEGSNAIAPTKKDFEQAFVSARQAKPDDVLVVYLSGHGTTLSEPKDTYCYLTSDAYTTELQDKAVRDKTVITSQELSEWCRSVPALKQVFILDTCGAGGAAKKLAERRNLSSDQIRAMDKLSDSSGIHLLMGCAADAVSYETSKYGQGLLTYALLRGMRGEKLDENKYIDVASLFEFAAEEVRQLARNIGGIQKPEIAAPGGTSFPIGLLTPEDKREIPLGRSCPVVIAPDLMDSELSDPLHLSEALKNCLKSKNEAEGTNEATSFVFVNTDEYPQGLKPRGLYRVKDNKASVAITLSCGEEKIKLPEVVGSAANVEQLAGQIVSAIQQSVAKMKPTSDSN